MILGQMILTVTMAAAGDAVQSQSMRQNAFTGYVS